jgi:uncharacterized protein (DUF111 family)
MVRPMPGESQWVGSLELGRGFLRKGHEYLPVPPPVTTATMPSTRKRGAASRLEEVMMIWSFLVRGLVPG